MIFLRKLTGLLIFTILNLTALSQVTTPVPVFPIPNPNQLRWQQMEYYAFIHLSVNTYTDKAWGFGDEDPKIFNPEKLDCRQWARLCKDAGMKGIILTAKHHSGFLSLALCLYRILGKKFSVAKWQS